MAQGKTDDDEKSKEANDGRGELHTAMHAPAVQY